MPYEILIPSSHKSGTPSRKPSLLTRVKTVLIAILALSLAVGVLAAAFMLGIVIAGMILLGIVAMSCILLVSRFWKQHQRGRSGEWPR